MSLFFLVFGQLHLDALMREDQSVVHGFAHVLKLLVEIGLQGSSKVGGVQSSHAGGVQSGGAKGRGGGGGKGLLLDGGCDTGLLDD